MATPSQVKSGLDEVAGIIAAQRAVVEKAQANAGNASAELTALSSTYSGVIATINGYTDTGDPFEILAKAELAQLTGEFQALKTAADTIVGIDSGS